MSANRVLRFSLDIDGKPHTLPDGQVTLVGPNRQGITSRVDVWVEVDGDETFEQELMVVGTGHEIPEDYHVVGSCFAGDFVWHVAKQFYNWRIEDGV